MTVLQPHPAAARAPDRVFCPSAHAALVRPCALSVASWSAAHTHARRLCARTQARRSSSGRTALGVATRGGVSPGCEGAEAASVPGSCDRVCVSCVRTKLGSAPAGRRSSASSNGARRSPRLAACRSAVTGDARATRRRGRLCAPPPPPHPSAPSRALLLLLHRAVTGHRPTRDRMCCRVLVSAARRRLRYGTTTGMSSRHISTDAPRPNVMGRFHV